MLNFFFDYMKRIKFLLLLVGVLSLNVISVAQPQMSGVPAGVDRNSGVVMGSVVDVNGLPLQYATINVKRCTDSLTAQYGITDADGKFMLEGIPFGKYFVEIQYVGYQKSTSPAFEISKENAVFKIPKYKMTDKNNEIEAVVIKAQRDMLQTNLDKTVFNVQSSINSAGQTAVEVLEEIPSVSVDVEGNVSLRGSENVTILVDGRATNLTLDQIPADMIESIEVITNPSARLEPDGMAGILNVVLKKKKEAGFNGMVSLGASSSCLYQNDKHNFLFGGWNADASFNYRYDKINIFVSYSYRNHLHHDNGTLWRESLVAGDTSRIDQYNEGVFGGGFHNANLSFDYYINKYNTLTLNLGGHFGTMKRNGNLWSTTSNITNELVDTLISYDQVNRNDNFHKSFEASLNYRKTFETPGMELTSDLFFTHRGSDPLSTLFQDHHDGMDNFYQYTTNLDKSSNAAAQVDFVTPVGNGGRIETGYKFTYRGNENDYHLYSGTADTNTTEDFTQRNDFKYTEMLNALYFIYSNTFWKKLQVQVGLRGEVANTISDLKTMDTVYKFVNYGAFAKNFFFPTIHLKYEINPENSLQFSFSRRVQRPRMHQLNPFIDYSDKENLNCGNPALQPEFANSFELGYMYLKNQTTFTLTAFYRRRTDMITRYTVLDTMRVNGEYVPYTMTSYMNYNKSQNFGLELFFSQRVKKVWRINVTGSFYRNIIDSDNLLDENLSRDWAWNAGVNQTFTVGKDFDIQLNFRYRSPSLTSGSMGWGTHGVGQGRRSASYFLNLGVKKGFINNSLILSFNVRNLLYFIPKVRQMQISSWQNCDVYGLDDYDFTGDTGYYSYSLREREGFNISLTLTYKLNNYRQRVQKEMGGDDYSEGEM